MRRPRKVGDPGAPDRMRLSPPASILLVDADEQERAMLRDALLEGNGAFELEAVAGAEEMGEHLGLAAHPPSLVVVDLDRDQPFAAIDRLKRDGRLRRVPVIALTGDREPDPALVARAYEAGVNTVLPKPVTFLALVRLVKLVTAYWLEAAILPGDEAA
jgi:CheY-like chemotaxis protein